MENVIFLNDIISGIDEMQGEDKVKQCIKRTLTKIKNDGYLDVRKIELIRQAYNQGLDDLRAVAWYLNHSAHRTVLMGVDRIKMEYTKRKQFIMGRISDRSKNREHRRFYNALSDNEKGLLAMRDLYGSWEDLESAITNGIVNNPQLFEWLNRLKNGSRSLEEQVEIVQGRISKMRQYETAYNINLAEFKRK